MTMSMSDGAVASPITGVVPQQVVSAQKVPRTDRLEVCREFQRGACKRPEQECRFAHPPDHVSTTDEGTVTVCMDAIKSRCSRDPCRYFHPPPHLQAQLRASQGRAAQQPVAFPGMGVPFKRPAGDKSGVPVYQPTGSAAYQQALMQQLGSQSFVPVSCEYGGSVPLAGVGGQADSQDTTAANNHAAASSAQPISSSSSTSTSTITNSPTSGKAVYSTSITANNSSSSTSSSSSTGGGELVPTSPAPMGPQQPVNVFSYTGYSLSKGLRPQFKPPTTHAPTVMSPMALSSLGFTHPGMATGNMPGFNYGIGSPMANLSFSPYASNSQQFITPTMTSSAAGMGLPGMMHGIGGLTAGVAPGMGGVTGLSGLNANVPFMNHSILMPQNHVSSLYPPQYTALSSNTQYSLAQGGEQPNKRLKTS
ncbi:uncharacterized protein DDB_G0271670-like isoform X1 [Homarus americanus]|uniref:uncharacterized protein DDB_G0271670-like isoform X1 n=1 Tax=Homarus americanus TaxID=6706 RepID=UPI001C460440|nr:uncharacterized protein DDB_G0271670-like isoform X1 [Homarus americanus]XP_042204967.1 uncharacterized protein DDB_G0271670-like isoform X1 [Homarus americanus]XP_042204968.1 uncharacterized protein DDB_G0271670-like isoform X1 [Homarus americanus]XP_042204969.1 uncharacterized protein DDB_G0271670-like isoform X1 [Homarus americanus]XP_042204970.1 uncharacterized protein DDB_G0271670-like isoform X1 [Homarus americanus]XP_042204972.1 uncharacterized protein DDB_G0271670-like isoform X1 [H